MKYVSSSIVLEEIPDEITLALEISSCPHHCKNCHSPELREDIGIPLTEDEIEKLVKRYSDISCICFMGGDRNHYEIINLAHYIKNKYKIKVGMYSGDKEIDKSLIPYLDYYKVGPYIEERGPLKNRNTNQRLYRINHRKILNQMEDITDRFWYSALDK